MASVVPISLVLRSSPSSVMRLFPSVSLVLVVISFCKSCGQRLADYALLCVELHFFLLLDVVEKEVEFLVMRKCHRHWKCLLLAL